MKIFKILLITFSLLITISITAQVAVNTNGATADQSSLLDVSSTSKGVLIPRMTATQRDDIASPANGLMVFVTNDQCFYYYDGSNWIKLLNNDSNDDDWTINGDNVYVSSGKKVGVGTSTPDGLLTIVNGPSSGEKSLKINNSYAGSGIAYGMYQGIIGNSSNVQYGNYIYFSNGGDGTHYGNYAYISGAGNGTQYGFYSKMFNIGNGTHYGFYSSVDGSGIGDQYGLKSSISNSGDGKHYAVYNALNGDGNGTQYAVYNNCSNGGTGSHYGVYNFFNSTSSGDIYGINNQLLISGNGTHYGIKNYLSGSGDGEKYGFYTSFSSLAGGTHYGIYVNALGNQHYAALLRGKIYIKDDVSAVSEPHNALSTVDASATDTAFFVSNNTNRTGKAYGIYCDQKGGGSGQQYGIYSNIQNTSNGYHYGTFNALRGVGAGKQYGTFNYIPNTGNGRHYGVYNELTVAGTDYHYGVYNKLTSTNSAVSYGSYNKLEGSGSGTKYGTYIEILASDGGAHYGVYCNVAGSSNWAGYFGGRVYMANNVGIGTTTPSVKLDVDGDVQFKNTSTDAVVDIESTSGAASLNIKAAGSSDLAQIKLFNASTERGWIGYDDANNRIFIKEGIKNVFIDNGNINPEIHKQQNLGYSGKAWKNIYYHTLYNQGAAAFVNRDVSKELLNFPPKEKKPGSFDYETEMGEVELDPASLPAGLHAENSILTDEMVSYNYKANYEQQLQIEELKEVIKKQNEKIEALLKMLSKDK